MIRETLHIFSDLQQLGLAAAKSIAQLSAEAITARGRFIVALSGGSLLKILGPALVTNPQIDWSAWRVCWADERYVPLAHPDRNYFLARQYLLDHVPIPPYQIYNPNTSLTLSDAAAAYQTTLTQLFAVSPSNPPTSLGEPSNLPPPPRFDLILLGLGEDGHTASLFPGHPLLLETKRWVVPVFDSPKPPPERITLTLPVFNNAHCVIFIAAGPGKVKILPQVFAPDSQLPAHLVQPGSNNLYWFINENTAKEKKV